jgi:hypothetical protein
VARNEPTERLAVGGIDVASNADEHAPVGQFLGCEDRSAGLLHLLDGWHKRVVQLNRTGGGQRELLPQGAMALEFDSKALAV